MRKIQVIFGIISQAKLPCPQNAAISLYNSCVINEWLAFQLSNCILILHILHCLRNWLKSYTRNGCFFVTIIKCLAFVMLFNGDVLCIRKTVFTTSRDFGVTMPTYNNSGLPDQSRIQRIRMSHELFWIMLKIIPCIAIWHIFPEFHTKWSKIRAVRNSKNFPNSFALLFIMFYRICKFESSTITNDVIMTSLPKTMAKFGPLRNQTNYISFERFWWELSKTVLFIEFEPLCQKLWALLSNFGIFTMPAHQIRYGHVTWLKMQISTIFYFVPILLLISGKVTKFLVEKLFTSEVISQKLILWLKRSHFYPGGTDLCFWLA